MTAPRRVLRLWVRPTAGGPVEERDALELVAGEGVVGDHTRGGKRHVTLIFEDDWNAAVAALGRPVDPSARRANALLSGGGGGVLIGTTLRLGDVVLEVRGETKPCHVMDAAAPGLQEALRPGTRAGVWATVETPGLLRTGLS